MTEEEAPRAGSDLLLAATRATSGADTPPSPADPYAYKRLVEAIDDYAIFMLDAEGRVASWNPGAQRFKGYAAADIIGEHFSRFYTPEDLESELPSRALKEARENGRFEHEGWRVRQSGERFWAHVVIDPIRGDEGEVIGFAKVTRDLTDRKRAEEALRHSEEQLRLLIQGVTDYAIYMLSPEGRVTSWNSGAERIKGYSRDEIVGEHFSRFYAPDDQTAGLPAHALSTAAAEGRFEREGWRIRKDGTRFWAHVVIDPVRDDAGQLVGFAKITRDVTERMEAQRALEGAREALFQSQKLEAIGQLTGGIAHDFNNLLTAVLGSLELVRKRLPYDQRVTPLIDNAVQGAQRGAALTQRMLAFARKQDLQMQPVDLGQLVRGMMDFLRRSIGSQVEIINQLPTDLPRVQTDPTQVESALLNLIVNARDAMPSGGRIALSAQACDVSARHLTLPAGRYVRLSVRDNGDGMDPATIAKATEPFFTTKGVGKGTGLGLSMVHGLMAQSGGDLVLNSAVGEGTTVDLWFPVASLPDAPADEASHRSVSFCAASSKTILLVDDDDLVLMNTAAMLEDLGHGVIAVSSGAEALDVVLARRDVDLVITDFVMPQMTGGALRARLEKLRPDLPVLVVSGYPDLDGAGRQRLDRHLPKPFTQQQLADAVRSVVPA